MISQELNTRFAFLRVSIVGLWILSLITVGVSPIYYVSDTNQANSIQSRVIHDQSLEKQIDEQYEIESKSVALRLTHNPFLVEVAARKSNTADQHTNADSSDEPLESEGGMTRNAPLGSSVALWLSSTSASANSVSSNSKRFSQQSEIANPNSRRSTYRNLTAASLSAEHPSKRFAATLLGQKPSGIS